MFVIVTPFSFFLQSLSRDTNHIFIGVSIALLKCKDTYLDQSKQAIFCFHIYRSIMQGKLHNSVIEKRICP